MHFSPTLPANPLSPPPTPSASPLSPASLAPSTQSYPALYPLSHRLVEEPLLHHPPVTSHTLPIPFTVPPLPPNPQPPPPLTKSLAASLLADFLCSHPYRPPLTPSLAPLPHSRSNPSNPPYNELGRRLVEEPLSYTPILPPLLLLFPVPPLTPLIPLSQ